MSDQSNLNSSADVPDKGKGKALDPQPEVSMDEDDDSSDSGVEEEVCFLSLDPRSSMC